MAKNCMGFSKAWTIKVRCGLAWRTAQFVPFMQQMVF
jgi:hypothetical protein